MKKIRFGLLFLAVFALVMHSQIIKAGDNVQSLGIEQLNKIDQENMDLLDKVINSSQSSLGGDSNVTFSQDQLDEMGNETGGISWGGGQQANLSGTGGVALIEHAKDQQQTLTSNVGSVMSNMNQTKKVIERKLGAQ